MTDDYCVFIGDASFDEYYRADNWPHHGTKIELEPIGTYPGGMIANAAAVYAGYGEEAHFCWVMNDSPNTDLLLADLAESGVDTRLVDRDNTLDDSRCIIVIAGDDHTVLTPQTGLSRIDLSDEALAWVTGARYVYTAIGDPVNVAARLTALAKGREMTAKMIERTPDLDFLYYSNDMIGAGGLLYLLEQGIDVPGKVGLAAFNGVELLDGLPRQLATMDACRREIGVKAAQIIVAHNKGETLPGGPIIALSPKLAVGDTLRRS